MLVLFSLFSELAIEGKGLIMADLAIEFKKESFYNDVIEVKIAFENISRISFEIYYSLSVLREAVAVQIAKAKTGMVCYDYQKREVTSLPEKFLAIIKS